MRVLMFTKYPVPGMVKTRLAQTIGPEHAARLQTAFIRDELVMLKALGVPVTLCCDPLVPLRQYQSLFGRELTCTAQHGADLGQRMLHALHAALDENPDGVVLIGSDLPDLPAQLIRQAFAALRSAPLCFGPAADGGFYLLGLRLQIPLDIFTAVDWGSGQVLTRTLANCGTMGLSPRLLESWSDVDTQADLFDYARRNKKNLTHCMNYIRTHGLVEDAWKP